MKNNRKTNTMAEELEYIQPIYASRNIEKAIPRYRIPDSGMSSDEAYTLVHDKLMLDGNVRLNLATFVTTWMEPKAKQLIADTLDKNLIDKDEYPQTADIEDCCIKMIAKLWNAPDTSKIIGCSTVGSSEGCMLGGLAMKRNWQNKMKAKGKKADKPNLVIGINAQICWEKFCNYWEVEMRTVKLEKGRYVLSPEEAVKLCDENTIGVVGILGSTYTGEYENIKKLDQLIDEYNKKTGYNIPIHVDAASGGFVAPFIEPDLIWDFRLKWVNSINASGHKYGLVYPGVGWAIWKDKKYLPENIIFYVDYLGGQIPTLTLNFSKPGNQVIAQYYNFLRLGFEGYKKIHKKSQQVATHLADQIESLGQFEMIHRGNDLPVITWTIKENMPFTLFELSDRLRCTGWQVPAYHFPENIKNISVMRIVVKEEFSRELADLLFKDMERAVEILTKKDPELHKKFAFRH